MCCGTGWNGRPDGCEPPRLVRSAPTYTIARMTLRFRSILLSLPLLASPLLTIPAAGQQTQPQSQPTTPPQTQPQTWTYTGPGNWTAAQTQPAATTTQPAANPTLDCADRLLAARKHGSARKLVLSWIRRNPRAADRDRALFLLAEAYYQYGDRVRAFYQLDELLDTYPESRLFYPALEKQYQIADRYLRGYKQRLFGIPLISAEEDAIDMLFRIQERAPGSPVAERALLRTADYYYADGQYDLAGDAYGAYARSYPRSPLVPRVRLRQAYSALAQFRGTYYDATPLVDARAQLEAIQAMYPEMAREENLSRVIERVDQTLAAKLYWTAGFYRRTNEPKAAVYTYRYLINRYPTSEEAQRAQRRLGQMPQWALADPPPTAATSEQDVLLNEPPAKLQ
jgi:outer membrane assembly lipoprotein YfiO